MSIVVDIKKVGLVIWGVQSGHRVFCFNSAITDPNIPEIKATWGDIRNLVVVNNLSVVFYALEFTRKYKVFSVYRPVNDFGRSGGYVAVSLYVPHQYKLQNVRGLLESISQAYLSDHYSFGEPLDTPETIGRYQQIIITQADSLSVDDEFRCWQESEQNHLTKLLPFNDSSVVDHFFAAPYREDFGLYQEIMFWNLNYLQNPAQFGITFLRELERFQLNGTDVSEEYQGDRIQPLSGLTMTYFKKNGQECKESYGQMGFYGPTQISFELVKNEYYQPVSFDGTVDEAVQRGFLLKTGKSYSWRSGISFEPKSFPLSVQFVGLEGVSDFLKVGLDERSMYAVREGHLDLELKGEEVQYKKSLFIDEFGLKRKVKEFVPESLPNYAGRYMLEVNTLRFAPVSFVGENAELPSRLSFTVRGFDGMASFDPRMVNGIVLSEDQNLSDLELSSGKYESRIEEGRIVLKKNYVRLRIVLPSVLEPSVKASGARFALQLNNGKLKLFPGLEDEIRYDDLPKDGVFKLYLLPNSADNTAIFPFKDLLVEETTEGILIKPRLMKVNNPDRTEFWQGSATARRRLWVCHDRISCLFIPETAEFASDEETSQFEINRKEGYSILTVKGRRVVAPTGDHSDKKVGEVFFSKEGTSGCKVEVFEHDISSDGVYRIVLSQEQNLLCLLPFPYDDNKYERLRKSFDPRLEINPVSAEKYNIVLKSDTEARKHAGRGTDAGAGHGKRKKSRVELPAWMLYAIIGAALLALLLSLWLIFFFNGSKLGEVSFELQNHNDIPVTITKAPKYTKAKGNVLTIYSKYDKDGENKIKGVELSFGNKIGHEYTDGSVPVEGEIYRFNRERKYVCQVSIPSLDTLTKAESLGDILQVISQYSKSKLVMTEGITRAQSIVNDDCGLLNTYDSLFRSIDSTSFIDDWHKKIQEEGAGQAKLNEKKKALTDAYNIVRSMDCTLDSVKKLEEHYNELKNLGVSDQDIINLCGKSCKSVIKNYKAFFKQLNTGSLDSFKEEFQYKNGRSKTIDSVFTQEQKKFIADKLVSGIEPFNRYQNLYNGEIGPARKSFRELNKD